MFHVKHMLNAIDFIRRFTNPLTRLIGFEVVMISIDDQIIGFGFRITQEEILP